MQCSILEWLPLSGSAMLCLWLLSDWYSAVELDTRQCDRECSELRTLYCANCTFRIMEDNGQQVKQNFLVCVHCNIRKHYHHLHLWSLHRSSGFEVQFWVRLESQWTRMSLRTQLDRHSTFWACFEPTMANLQSEPRLRWTFRTISKHFEAGRRSKSWHF